MLIIDAAIANTYAKTMWNVPCLQYTIIFVWHINAKPEQIAHALEIGEMTVDVIQWQRNRGIELFSVIRGF
jgi:hypothetical protein